MTVVNTKLEAFGAYQHCCSTCWIAQVNVLGAELWWKVCFARTRCCGKGQERSGAGAKPGTGMSRVAKLHADQQRKKFGSFPRSFWAWLETNFFCFWCWKSDPCCPKQASRFFKACSWGCHSCRGVVRGGGEGERGLGWLEKLNVIAGVCHWLTPWLEQERANTRVKHSCSWCSWWHCYPHCLLPDVLSPVSFLNIVCLV